MRKIKWRNDLPKIYPEDFHRKLSVEERKVIKDINSKNCDIEYIKELAKKKIDLKSILGYDKLNEQYKNIVDKLLAVMPQEEVEDLTVWINIPKSEHRNMSAFLSDSWTRYEDNIDIVATLPVLKSSNGKIKYKDINMGEELFTSDYIKTFIKENVYSDHEEKLQKLGFRYGTGGNYEYRRKALPIPTDKIFDVIKSKIRAYFHEMIEEGKRIGLDTL